ncbi:MAG: HAMP domain-containing histidine kinase [Lachnospiraceae bacterium]|nr:HAMP domain-containing histidine kinase [Lachnospiraceae bacterium]
MKNIMVWAILFGVLNLSVLAAVYFLLARHVNDTLDTLSDMIEDLICGKERIEFPIAEDTVISKLQGQLLKLYDILCSHKEREQKLRKQLDENIGNLVHQINTPITNLRLYVDFLKRDDLTAPEREKFLSCMEEQAQKLFWLGESFSQISRLETGIIRLRPEKQKVEPVLLNAIDQVMVKAENKGMEISLSGETQTAALIDLKWTTEALFNILDNAVKYSKPETKIEIIAADLSNYVSIAVRNESEIKIDPDEYYRLFQRFYRGKANSETEGVGLGLYIARKILEDENAYIKAETKPDGMTEFAVFLYKGQALN